MAPSVLAGAWLALVSLLARQTPGNVGLSRARQTVTAKEGAVNGIVTGSPRAVAPGVTVSLSGPSLITTEVVVTTEKTFRIDRAPGQRGGAARQRGAHEPRS